MTHPAACDEYAHQRRSQRDASDRRAMLTEILAQVCRWRHCRAIRSKRRCSGLSIAWRGVRVVRELELANRKLEQLSMSNGLTGIANRRSFDQRLAEEWQRHAQSCEPLTLLLVDVDCFKALNDACGHVFGDECLRELARLCAEIAMARRSTSRAMVARSSCCCCRGMPWTNRRGLAWNCAVASRRWRSSIPLRSRPTTSPSALASALPPGSEAPPESLIAAADRALYLAKARGRKGVVALPCM